MAVRDGNPMAEDLPKVMVSRMILQLDGDLIIGMKMSKLSKKPCKQRQIL